MFIILFIAPQKTYSNDSLNVTMLDTEFEFWYSVDDVDTKDNLAFVVGSSSGLHVFDIADPGNPIPMGFLLLSRAYTVEVFGNYAYVTNRDTNGSYIQIVNISDPWNPHIESTLSYEYYSWSNFVVDQNTLYVSKYFYGGQNNTNELLVYDISSPDDPVLICNQQIEGQVCDFALSDQKLYLPVKSEQGLFFLKIFNIINPASLVEMSNTRVFAPVTNFFRMRVLVENSTLYLSADDDLLILDVTDTLAVSTLGSLTVEWDVCEIALRDNHIISINNLQMRVIDVSDPSQPTEVNFIEPDGIFSNFSIHNNELYVLVGPYVTEEPTTFNLSILDISDLEDIEEIGSINNHNSINSVHSHLDYLYVTTQDGSSILLDISNPNDMTICGDYDALKGDLYTQGNLLVQLYADSLSFYDNSDPLSPILLYSGPNQYDISKISIKENYLFGFKYWQNEEFYVFDISNPSDGPILLTTFNGESSNHHHYFFPNNYHVYEDFVYMIGGFGEDDDGNNLDLMVLNINEDGSLTEASRVALIDGNNSPRFILTSGDMLILADNDIFIYDLSDPLSPAFISSIQTGVYLYDIKFDGNQLFLALEHGFRIIDVVDPSAPQETGYYYMDSGYENIINYHDGVVYLSRFLQLQSFDVSGAMGVEDKYSDNFIPSDFAIVKTYPNPFNPTLNITVALPEVSNLKVTVSNVLGREVATLSNSVFPAGTHNLVFDGSELSSGIYFVRASAPGRMEQVQKVVLMK